MELRFPLILDGATGTELQRRGYTGDISMEQWTLAHPDSIRELQRGYVDAGSRVLYTPTFGGNAVRLAAHGVTEDVAAYNRRWATPPPGSWWTPTPSRWPDWRRPVWICTLSRR